MNRPAGRFLLFASLAALALAGHPATTRAQAHGDESRDAETERARALFFEGVELMQQESYAEAADRFRQTLEIRRSAPVALNLALALYEIGQLTEARSLLSEVVDDPSVQRRMRRQARRTLREIEPRLGHLTVTVTGDTTGVEVTLDGEPVAPEQLGAPMAVDPGSRTLVATRGSRHGTQTVDVAEGASMEVTLEIPPPSAAEAAQAGLASGPLDEGPAEASSDGGLLGQWWFWTAVGAVVLGGLLSAILLASSGSPDPLQGDLDPPLLEVRP